MSTHVTHHFPIDLIDVLLGCCQFLLKSHFLLLQGIFGAFSIFIDHAFDFSLHISLIHGVDNILTISVELRREYFRHSLRRVGLVDTGRLLDELL